VFFDDLGSPAAGSDVGFIKRIFSLAINALGD
jgi:hypothetical protein